MRPGKTPASATSRPVLPAQKPPVADDQFVPGAPSLRPGDPSAKHELMNPKNKKELRPVSAEAGATASDSPAGKGQPTSEDVLSGTETSKTSTTPEVAGAPALPRAAQSASIAASKVSAPVAAPAAPASGAAVAAVAPTENPTPSVSPIDAMAHPAHNTADSEASIPQASSGGAGATIPPAQPAAPTIPVPEEETPAHLAMEQTVQTSPDIPIWEQPENSVQVETSARPDAARPASSKSIEDLLAETGAPTLEPEKTPSLIISHHKPRHKSGGKTFIVVLLILVLTVAIFDILLDTEIIKTGLDLPHTDFL